MAPKLIAANWKENPATQAAADKLFRAVAKIKPSKNVRVAVCPPFVYLEEIAAFRKRTGKRSLALGAQDAFWEEKGAFTGAVGPKMLKSLGVQYVIVGHSERRKWFHETDTMVNRKAKLVLRDGLTIILCVGEPLAVRKRGLAAARKFVANQLSRDLAGIPGSAFKRVVIAYEPIWAIGTGRYDPAEDASAMADFIKKTASIRNRRAAPAVLYGGSVNGKNIGDYLTCENIDGALVGGASLRAEEFKIIVAAAGSIKK